MIAVVIVFMVVTLVAGAFVLGPQINDWIDDMLWAVVNRREYRRLTAANPHLRPETLAQMTRRAWQERQRSTV